MILPSRYSKAFTLLELIVILGILAAIAIPIFQKVIEKSKQASVDRTLEAVDRNARSLAGFDQTGVTKTHLDASEKRREEATLPRADPAERSETSEITRPQSTLTTDVVMHQLGLVLRVLQTQNVPELVEEDETPLREAQVLRGVEDDRTRDVLERGRRPGRLSDPENVPVPTGQERRLRRDDPGDVDSSSTNRGLHEGETRSSRELDENPGEDLRGAVGRQLGLERDRDRLTRIPARRALRDRTEHERGGVLRPRAVQGDQSVRQRRRSPEEAEERSSEPQSEKDVKETTRTRVPTRSHGGRVPQSTPGVHGTRRRRRRGRRGTETKTGQKPRKDGENLPEKRAWRGSDLTVEEETPTTPHFLTQPPTEPHPVPRPRPQRREEPPPRREET